MSALLRRCFFLVVAFALSGVFQSPAALAGTTGSIVGTVTDGKTLKPLAGVRVEASSPSQSVTATTDANGRFTFISLAPDTYAITLAKSGYERLVAGGITVQADQELSEQLSLQPSLQQIGHVTARSPLDLVKPGTTSDVYSVGQAVTAGAAPLGGGGALNSAYSAIASLPGVFVPPGQQGVNQSVFIRGGYYDQIGYEYDGVPMNRSFDNYPAHAASTLGQQELQVYTGGGGAGASATGLAGFINQVVRTGTNPGFTELSARLGAPAFDHDLHFEYGGATPSRSFSYYVGALGSNQDFRYLDQFNGAGQLATFPG
ncbi:MAG TPA: carboxypeptidase regulatory-like domain-containing protein, partial [Candidatus Elarobacter sp.]|nr:carboxypeptidase regulatory-like domain-containing protein [Candidatus Elarobacter sp.]